MNQNYISNIYQEAGEDHTILCICIASYVQKCIIKGIVTAQLEELALRGLMGVRQVLYVN
jgi:hypothetical protein